MTHFNIDYQVNRSFIYALEFVRSEMELRLNKHIEANIDYDATEAQKKIDALENVQMYLHEVYEVIEKLKKEIDLKDLTNKKLHAEINILKKD